jgi:phosphonate metabolism protein PhnN/1,5-bisphosphokinase (PRPP-forming)
MAEGRLVLVVGPSGAGKDTLIAAAAAALANRPLYDFPKRQITRASDAGGEDHIAVSPAEFAAHRDSGGYALHWVAHGLSYGIPASIDAAIATGVTVVVNTSRTIIEAARARYPSLRIIFVTAPIDVLARRIAARGRESADDVATRLGRAGIIAPSGSDVVELHNDGSIHEAVAAFLRAIGA